MARNDNQNKALGHKGRGQIGFLLSQIGGHAAAKFAELVRPLGISPSHAGMMRLIGQSPGLSQRDLCARLSILPSRLVVLVDELESKGLVERRDDSGDRRSYALFLTEKGQKKMGEIGELARAHGDLMSEGLTAEERATLTDLLSKIAEAQGLTPGVHPGYKNLGKREG